MKQCHVLILLAISFTARAEYERSRQPPMLVSQSIAQAIYNLDDSTMALTLRSGAVWRFHQVPESRFDAFALAGNKGAFYNKRIRGYYRADLVKRRTGEGGDCTRHRLEELLGVE